VFVCVVGTWLRHHRSGGAMEGMLEGKRGGLVNVNVFGSKRCRPRSRCPSLRPLHLFPSRTISIASAFQSDFQSDGQSDC
jgi:hypothetical protein